MPMTLTEATATDPSLLLTAIERVMGIRPRCVTLGISLSQFANVVINGPMLQRGAYLPIFLVASMGEVTIIVTTSSVADVRAALELDESVSVAETDAAISIAGIVEQVDALDRSAIACYESEAACLCDILFLVQNLNTTCGSGCIVSLAIFCNLNGCENEQMENFVVGIPDRSFRMIASGDLDGKVGRLRRVYL